MEEEGAEARRRGRATAAAEEEEEEEAVRASGRGSRGRRGDGREGGRERD